MVEESLRPFLNDETPAATSGSRAASKPVEGRTPGPFIEDRMIVPPIDLPRDSRAIACTFLRNATRQPTLFPGE
jgi:hypothetical protein